MSMILEALRKSEAERRRGQMPDLRAELPPVPQRRARALPRGWWLLPAAALLALATWWALRERTPQTGADVVPAMAQDATRMPANAPPAADALPVRTPVQAAADAPPPVAPAVVPSGTGTTIAAAPAIDRGSTAPPPPSALPPPATSAPPSPPAAPNAAGATRPADGAPLKLTMHMWNAQPAQRFVIIDGQRLREGDRVGDAVVERIDSDGVVLDRNGQKQKLDLR